jgi:DNA-binding XRE family transcriptional regulator
LVHQYDYISNLPFWKLFSSILDKTITRGDTMAKKKYDKIERINQSQYPLIGSNIRRLRKEQNLKAVDIIAKLQLQGILITTGTFSKIENGYNNPSVNLLIALTQIFHCDYNEFFNEKKN